MAAPLFSTSDYLAALQALMPRGRVWPKDQNSVQTKALTAFSQEFQRTNLSANNLLVDSFPVTTTDLLVEWEESLGLPDPCAGLSPTIQLRRNQVVAKLTATGGQSAAYMIKFAANLGYTITITQYAPFRMGQGRCGMPLGGPDWAFAWRVNAPTASPIFFRTGQSAMGEPLESWGNTVLQCQMQEIAPAHTILNFSYN